MLLSANFDYSSLDHTKDNTAHLVVSLTAPEIDWIQQRPKICILPLLDVSGSMQGDKLKYAKASIRKLIEQLSPGDFAGLALFESRMHMVVKPGPVTPEHRTALFKALDAAHIMGGTNFSDALVESLRDMQALDLPPSFLHRVILFTDGQPTEGIVDQASIKKILADQRGRVTVSFFGYGGEARSVWTGCDQNFMTELSELGAGNYAYVQNPDDSLAAFGKELGGLLSTYASDLKLIVEPLKGHKISKVVTNLNYETDPMGELTFELNSILAEEVRHIVLEALLEKQSKAFPRDTKVFDVKVTYMKTTQEGSKTSETVQTSAKVRFVRSADAQEKPTPEVDAVVGLHQMVQAQLEAEEQAKKGRYADAQTVMTKVSDSLGQRGHVGLTAAAAHTSVLLADRESYTGSQGYLGSMRRGTRGVGVSSFSADAQSLLRSAGVSISNSAQQHFATAFVAPSEPAAETLVVPEE